MMPFAGLVKSGMDNFYRLAARLMGDPFIYVEFNFKAFLSLFFLVLRSIFEPFNFARVAKRTICYQPHQISNSPEDN